MSQKTFVLEEENNSILDFPDVRQSNGYTCGCDALLAVLYYYGLGYREDKLAKILGTTKDGTDPDAIIKFCRKLGFTVESGKMSIKKLKNYIDKKIPVIVAIQAWTDQKNVDWEKDYLDGHYTVVIGYNKDNIIFEDPSLLNKGYIPQSEFLTRWHDVDKHNKKYQNLGIAISGKKPKYNSRLIKLIK
ncbi:MAG: cysteine peptidase family C39 domain-containing protein [Planctomycetes bacterium]|jgi:predicted double-glycine peptidase|nr:cysteine peptidase family C39 domain-containing protein [Planctomycetota bacterium]